MLCREYQIIKKTNLNFGKVLFGFLTKRKRYKKHLLDFVKLIKEKY